MLRIHGDGIAPSTVTSLSSTSLVSLGHQPRYTHDSLVIDLTSLPSHEIVASITIAWSEVFSETRLSDLQAQMSYRGSDEAVAPVSSDWYCSPDNSLEVHLSFFIPSCTNACDELLLCSFLRAFGTDLHRLPVYASLKDPSTALQQGHVLWVHVMDAVGFPLKNKHNLSVLLDIVVDKNLLTRVPVITSHSDIPEPPSVAVAQEKNDFIVVSVESAKSAHLKTLIWDQFLELAMPLSVTRVMLQRCGKLRASIWLHDPHTASGDGGGTLQAVSEARLADILPALADGKGARAGAESLLDRHEVVLPLYLSASHYLDSNARIPPSTSAPASPPLIPPPQQMRLRFGLLFQEYNPLRNSPSGNRVDTETLSRFMKKRGKDVAP